jgi:hypothetical protein
MPALRIWSETVPFDMLGSPEIIRLLQRYPLQPLLAVRPGDLPGLRPLLARYRDAGIQPGLWPMLADVDGRWANARNIDRFITFVRDVMKAAEGWPLSELAIDLEPDIQWMRPLVGLGGRWAPGGARAGGNQLERAREQLRELVAALRSQGTRSLAAVMLPVAMERERHGWQSLLGTPIDGIGFEHLSVMAYTSLLEGWSYRTLRRREARVLLAAFARATVERFGAAGGLSLGTVGIGALGNEPRYRGPEELADDVGIARASGVAELTLHDLGGVLAHPPAEAWLDAFVNAPTASDLPERTVRSRAAIGGLRFVTSLLGW